LPAAWAQVLERIERSLEETLALTDQREQESRSLGSAGDAAFAADGWRRSLDRLDDCLSALEASTRQAEEHTAAVDAVLAAGLDGLNRWLVAASATGQRLAEWAGGEL